MVTSIPTYESPLWRGGNPQRSQSFSEPVKTSIREVVDGQQRLRTILSYVRDGFVISRVQNPEFGGKRFSQLDEETQGQILAYEIAVDLLINLPDTEVLDIFSRLNSYAVVLNEQEKLNAQYLGPFKISADNIGRKYTDFWISNTILTSKEVLRMAEVNLVADLLIAMIEGLKPKKKIRGAYKEYETRFDTIQTTYPRYLILLWALLEICSPLA